MEGLLLARVDASESTSLRGGGVKSETKKNQLCWPTTQGLLITKQTGLFCSTASHHSGGKVDHLRTKTKKAVHTAI